MFDLIAFDADDTLWQNETVYSGAYAQVKPILAQYYKRDDLEEKLQEAEIRSLKHFGYGIKGFILAMVAAAVELTQEQIPAREIQKILEVGIDMLEAEVCLIEHAEETVVEIGKTHRLMLLTKGDLLEQEGKITRSGLRSYFRYIEIVSGKSAGQYRAILERHGVEPARFLMVGNSIKSDILPVLEIGGSAVYIPHALTWAHEQETEPDSEVRGYYKLDSIAQVSELLRKMG